MKEKKKLLKLSEAAELLNVHPNTLRQWDKKGILKAVRFGQRGDRRYKKEDIEKFINTQKTLDG
jgi:excisionase family DNA binding protein